MQGRQSPRPLRNLPYLVHTNRELGLMLRGLKPLARFVEAEGWFPDVLLRYFRLFDRHVSSGRLVRHDEMISDREMGRLHYVYFARIGEEWRIPAMIELLAVPGRWTRDLERREGELLGYTKEQNNYWLDLHYPEFD